LGLLLEELRGFIGLLVVEADEDRVGRGQTLHGQLVRRGEAGQRRQAADDRQAITFETFSVTTLEAMSLGLPVVITGTNGLAPDVRSSGAPGGEECACGQPGDAP
jgi:hypothetical protein